MQQNGDAQERDPMLAPPSATFPLVDALMAALLWL